MTGMFSSISAIGRASSRPPVPLGVDVGDLLQLERALQRHRILRSPSRKSRSRAAENLYAACWISASCLSVRSTSMGSSRSASRAEIGVAHQGVHHAAGRLFLLAVRLGRLRGTLDAPTARQHLEALRELPMLVERTLKHEAEIQQAAYKFSAARGLLFLGRGPQYPVALEGALKLKEISTSTPRVRGGPR